MGVLDKFLDAIKVNDDYDDDEFLDDEFDDDFDDEKPKRRFFKKLEEDDDDLDDYEPRRRAEKQPAPKAAKTAKPQKTVKSPSSASASSSKVTPMRQVKRTGSAMEVCVIKPTNMEDTREIADTLIANCTVILNLEGLDMEVAQRIIDFTSGACYSLGGSLQKVSSYIFVLGPSNVDITGDLQNILGGSVPSVRAGY